MADQPEGRMHPTKYNGFVVYLFCFLLLEWGRGGGGGSGQGFCCLKKKKNDFSDAHGSCLVQRPGKILHASETRKGCVCYIFIFLLQERIFGGGEGVAGDVRALLLLVVDLWLLHFCDARGVCVVA